jgi:hypothetical protein
MKTTVLVAMLLTTAIASPSNAGSPADFYANCCVVGSVRFRDLSKETQGGSPIMVGASNRPDYESYSRTVIRSNYGTTVIRGIYRSNSR